MTKKVSNWYERKREAEEDEEEEGVRVCESVYEFRQT